MTSGLFPENDKKLQASLEANKGNTARIIICNSIYPTDKEVLALLNYVWEGNQLFLSANNFDGLLLDSLKLKVSDYNSSKKSMGISINNLKTLAFVAGAALAGFAGAIYAGVQLAVFVNGFDVPLLTLIYAAVILGGSGSIPGAIMGAFIMSVLPEILRVPEYSEILFIAVLTLTIITLSKSIKKILLTFVALLVTGFIGLLIFQLFGVKRALDETWAIGPVSKIMKNWLFVPENQIFWGNISFVLLIAAIAYYTTASKKIRMIALPIIGYLAIFLWEVRLIANPSVTRQLIIGALLIVLMIVRPQGFLGKARVEVL
jgi:hypothetical protein